MTEPPLLTPVPADTPRPWLARNWGLVLMVVVVAVGAVIAVKAHQHAKKLAGHQVTYSVTGGGPATDINYSTAGGSQQVSGATLPWTYSAGLRALGSTAALSLLAQNDPSATGPITCTITVDGAVAASNTSNGAAAVVTCTALIH